MHDPYKAPWALDRQYPGRLHSERSNEEVHGHVDLFRTYLSIFKCEFGLLEKVIPSELSHIVVSNDWCRVLLVSYCPFYVSFLFFSSSLSVVYIPNNNLIKARIFLPATCIQTSTHVENGGRCGSQGHQLIIDFGLERVHWNRRNKPTLRRGLEET
jgi:hypothetical protein